MEKKARLEALSKGGDRNSIGATSNSTDSPTNPKASLKKKFRNSPQQPLSPLPIVEGGVLSNGEHHHKELGRESPVPSPAANLKNKFRR